MTIVARNVVPELGIDASDEEEIDCDMKMLGLGEIQEVCRSGSVLGLELQHHHHHLAEVPRVNCSDMIQFESGQCRTLQR